MTSQAETKQVFKFWQLDKDKNLNGGNLSWAAMYNCMVIETCDYSTIWSDWWLDLSQVDRLIFFDGSLFSKGPLNIYRPTNNYLIFNDKNWKWPIWWCIKIIRRHHCCQMNTYFISIQRKKMIQWLHKQMFGVVMTNFYKIRFYN